MERIHIYLQSISKILQQNYFGLQISLTYNLPDYHGSKTKKAFLYRELVVKEKLLDSNLEPKLLKNEKIVIASEKMFNRTNSCEKFGFFFLTNMRVLFASHKFFSVSFPLFQILKITVQKKSSRGDPLIILKLSKMVGGLKLAFGFGEVTSSSLNEISSRVVDYDAIL